ncbi:MAG: bifunctional phosphopantothenoylcysteine decarboxylase/phosphopantothenate--cysteine ligase CoaBC [Candidatus Latescibacteria bacterium]|nr:bifunctional phosphopantothenoylcysteine decarboxylase/phosphopantothenate--cysteine ligase CoaBC [Candidatus Latescibacterota bacterium]
MAERRILLGVTGSIAAYKAVEVVRALKQRGADVIVVMTPAATHFVGPMTFSALSGRSVAVEQFPADGQAGEEHLDLARWAEIVAIVPATADIIGKMANGLADDLLSTFLLACEAPCCLAPAMNFRMLRHPAVQANLVRLVERGCRVIEPEYGRLADGEVGEGRLADLDRIVQVIADLADRRHDLDGRRVLVTAGPTVEPIDPVRFISNRSSGKMGYAIAEVARRRGAEVTLISGPTHLPAPAGVTLVRVRTAEEMRQRVWEHLPGQDAVIMAAAVADYRPQQAAVQKIKKREAALTLDLERTTDILSEVAARRPPVLVGFAVETHDGLAYARKKLVEKHLDMVVYNDVTVEGAGFEVDTNIVTLIHRDGREEDLP